MRNRTMLHRFGAGMLAVMLAFSLAATPAFATEGGEDGETEASESIEAGNNTVVVRKAVPSAKYELYKLLKLDAKAGEKDGETAVVSYRYSYDAALKDIISKVVVMKDFAYDPVRGYGFKADNDVVVFVVREDAATEVSGAEGNDVESNAAGDNGAEDNAAAEDTGTEDNDVESDAAEDNGAEDTGVESNAAGDNGADDAAVRAMMVAFADEMRSRIEGTAGLKPVASETAPAAGENLTVSFKNVPDGYWMVTSNAGARSIVFTTPGEDGSETMVVKEKNPAPQVTKKVWDKDDYNAGGSWQADDDAEIGETMTFMISVDLYKGSENIRIHDEMSDGLTFEEIKNVKFYPRKDSETYGREVYLLDGEGDTTAELDLTGDARVYTDKKNEHGFVLTFRNSFTNPAAGADNRDPDDARNNVFLGDLSTLEDDGGKIEIVYTATLNKDAVAGVGPQLDCDVDHEHGSDCYVDGNTNVSYVQYGHIPGVDPGEEPDPDDDPPGETPRTGAESKIYTYRFEIDKFVNGSPETKLAGAEFEIRKAYAGIGGTGSEDSENAWIDGENLILPEDLYDISGSAPVSLVDITPKTEGYDGGKVYRVATSKDSDSDKVTKVVTDGTGLITIQGVDSNLYSITETAAPSGYNRLAAPVMIAVGSVFSGEGGTVFEEDLDATRGEDDPYVFAKLAHTTVGIANSSGIILPDAGGIGTTIFYVGGVALVLGAAVLLVVKKRAGRSKG